MLATVLPLLPNPPPLKTAAFQRYRFVLVTICDCRRARHRAPLLALGRGHAPRRVQLGPLSRDCFGESVQRIGMQRIPNDRWMPRTIGDSSLLYHGAGFD